MSGFDVRVKVEGFEAIERKLRDLPDRGMAAIGGALYRRGEAVMTRSKEEFVPVDIGTLRDSGYVAPPERARGEVSVELGYGGAAAAYAVVQHEDLTLNHPRGGEAKFLEKPLVQEAPSMLARIALDVRKDLGL